MRLFLAEHLQHLALLAAVDAQRRPALLPVREPGVLRLDRLEAAPLQRRALGVLDRVLDRALAIGIPDAAGIGHHAVVREHRGVDRVQFRLVEVRADHAFLEVVEHDVCGQPPKARKASSCSCAQISWLDFHTTLRKLLPENLSVITNRYGRLYLPRAVQRRRALPVVDLRFLAGQELQHVEALRCARLERRHEALHRVVAWAKPCGSTRSW